MRPPPFCPEWGGKARAAAQLCSVRGGSGFFHFIAPPPIGPGPSERARPSAFWPPRLGIERARFRPWLPSARPFCALAIWPFGFGPRDHRELPRQPLRGPARSRTDAARRGNTRPRASQSELAACRCARRTAEVVRCLRLPPRDWKSRRPPAREERDYPCRDMRPRCSRRASAPGPSQVLAEAERPPPQSTHTFRARVKQSRAARRTEGEQRERSR